MVIVDLLRDEAHLHSVRGIKRLTPFAEDADACLIINKKAHAQHVATQLPGLENVHELRFRRLVT